MELGSQHKKSLKKIVIYLNYLYNSLYLYRFSKIGNILMAWSRSSMYESVKNNIIFNTNNN